MLSVWHRAQGRIQGYRSGGALAFIIEIGSRAEDILEKYWEEKGPAPPPLPPKSASEASQYNNNISKFYLRTASLYKNTYCVFFYKFYNLKLYKLYIRCCLYDYDYCFLDILVTKGCFFRWIYKRNNAIENSLWYAGYFFHRVPQHSFVIQINQRPHQKTQIWVQKA